MNEEIDEERLKKMLNRIIELENDNIDNNQSNKLVNEIMKIIEEEAKCL